MNHNHAGVDVARAISGRTRLIAHIGWPTHAFRSPAIYNPYFQHRGLEVVVVPMACQAEHYPQLIRQLFHLENLIGALITMPHKVSTVALLDKASLAVQMAGACNALKRDADRRLVGDLFDGEGFVRAVRQRGFELQRSRAFVAGCGGVGAAIAAALAASNISHLGLFDPRQSSAEQLQARLQQYYPQLSCSIGCEDLGSYHLVVNASPLGMQPSDPLPLPVAQLSPLALVADVVMRVDKTPWLEAAEQHGCTIQFGSDMLFEQIPAYLEFFGLPTTTAAELRALSEQ